MQVVRLKLELVFLGKAYKYLKEFRSEEGFPFLEGLYKDGKVDEFINENGDELVSTFGIVEEFPVEEDPK